MNQFDKLLRIIMIAYQPEVKKLVHVINGLVIVAVWLLRQLYVEFRYKTSPTRKSSCPIFGFKTENIVNMKYL